MTRKVDHRLKISRSVDDKRTDRVKKAERDRMLRLRENRKTLEEIAFALNRSERTVSKQLNRARADRQQQAPTLDPLVMKKKEEHFNYMAEIAKGLLTTTWNHLDDIVPNPDSSCADDEYVLGQIDHGVYRYGRKQLSEWLQTNLELASGEEYMTAEQAKREWADGSPELPEFKVYPQYDFQCLMAHVEAECPEVKSKGLDLAVEENPYEVVDAVRRLSRQKVFKGKCPICKDW